MHSYQFTLGRRGSKSGCRCLIIPSGCKQGAHTPERDIFSLQMLGKKILLWGSGETENNKTCLTIPSWSKKSPGRLPRPVKVKNLTPQEKVKEWIQTLPPTRTATSEAILIIKS